MTPHSISRTYPGLADVKPTFHVQQRNAFNTETTDGIRRHHPARLHREPPVIPLMAESRERALTLIVPPCACAPAKAGVITASGAPQSGPPS